MIVTVANTKGGVGKTTLAIQLAVELARAGRHVWLVDGDKQATAQDAITVRAESGKEPGIACACYPDGAVLRTQLQQQLEHYTDVVIDAGGRDSTALRAALVLSELMLVPFMPRSYDVWALDDLSQLLQEARAVNDVTAYAVLNAADPAGRDNADAVAALEGYPAFRHLDTPLGRRKAYANAAGRGLSVLELPGRERDPKAEAELAALRDSILKLY